MVLNLLSFLVSCVFILLGIAFFTLLERKGLGYSQNRKGPDKTGWGGLIQPLLDGLKLIIKTPSIPHQISWLLFYIFPAIFFLLMLQMWFSFSSGLCFLNGLWGLFLFICISGVSSITLLIIGITSYSKFGIVGGMRGVAQGVSYEVVFSILIFSVASFFSSSSFLNSFISPALFFIFYWMICLMAETNRAPFDFAEGESELISGFNIEYSGGPFIFIFLAEYGFVLAMSLIMSKVFFGFYVIGSFFIFFTIVMIRGLFPRFRYDALMGVCWFYILPQILFCSFSFMTMKF